MDNVHEPVQTNPNRPSGHRREEETLRITDNEIILRRWFDRHLHLRQGEMLRQVLPCTTRQHATGGIIMGNTDPPISTMKRAVAYRHEIQGGLPDGSDFNPLLALYLTDETEPGDVIAGAERGYWRAVKLYMANVDGGGGTTGSQHGVRDLKSRYPVFEKMQERRIPLLGHFEAVEDEVDEFDRMMVSAERDLLPIMREFPELPIVVEHITDSRVADIVAEAPHPIYATVTAHHLFINRNDLFRHDGKSGMCPANYCKPVAQREEHRLAIRKYVTSGHARFGAGTDSAPHPRAAKERCYGCAAGIFTAPCAVELYATAFDEDRGLVYLEKFLSENFLNIYGLVPTDQQMTLQREPYRIPEWVGDVPVFKGDSILPWRLQD